MNKQLELSKGNNSNQPLIGLWDLKEHVGLSIGFVRFCVETHLGDTITLSNKPRLSLADGLIIIQEVLSDRPNREDEASGLTYFHGDVLGYGFTARTSFIKRYEENLTRLQST